MFNAILWTEENAATYREWVAAMASGDKEKAGELLKKLPFHPDTLNRA